MQTLYALKKLVGNRKAEEDFRREAQEPRPWEAFLIPRPASLGEALERAKERGPQGWRSQVGCWGKGHSRSESNSQVHRLRLC